MKVSNGAAITEKVTPETIEMLSYSLSKRSHRSLLSRSLYTLIFERHFVVDISTSTKSFMLMNGSP